MAAGEADRFTDLSCEATAEVVDDDEVFRGIPLSPFIDTTRSLTNDRDKAIKRGEKRELISHRRCSHHHCGAISWFSEIFGWVRLGCSWCDGDFC